MRTASTRINPASGVAPHTAGYGCSRSPAASVIIVQPMPIVRPQAPTVLNPEFALLGPRPRIGNAGGTGGLPLQLGVAAPACLLEPPVGERGLHGASRLGLMGAIAEAAGSGQLLDVRECRGYACFGIPQPEFAHARRIQQQASI